MNTYVFSPHIYGNVLLNSDVSVWFNAVIRSETEMIDIDEGTNIQDGCIIHTDEGYPVMIGHDVTIGHGSIIHGCTIGHTTLIGMGSIILDGATIGHHCLIGAGTLITGNTYIPDYSVVMGHPGKVVRNISEKEIEHIEKSAKEYIEKAKIYQKRLHNTLEVENYRWRL